MKWTGIAQQQDRHFLYDASGTTVGGTAKLILARSMSRSMLYLKNTSLGPMTLEFDGARATATITNGVVTSVAITNAGFGYTNPPVVRFLGGGPAGGAAGRPGYNSSYLGLAQPNGPAPSNVAQGQAVLTGGAVSSITINNGGSGYVVAPYVQLLSSDLDPYGCAVPSATVGWSLAAGETLIFNGSCCPTEAIAGFTAANGSYVCRWMD